MFKILEKKGRILYFFDEFSIIYVIVTQSIWLTELTTDVENVKILEEWKIVQSKRA